MCSYYIIPELQGVVFITTHCLNYILKKNTQMKQIKLLSLSTVLILLMSCGDNKKPGTPAEPGEKEEQPKPETSKTAGEPRATIKLTLAGDEMAGTYEAVCKDACCSYGIAGDKIFGNQYSETGKGPKELSSVQLVVNDVTGNKTTNNFLVTVSFGELFGKDSKSYTINTDKGNTQGSGTLDLQYSPDKATVHIKGKSKEGAEIDLQMECHKIMTMNNLLEETQQ
jgi:hypothetical protein